MIKLLVLCKYKTSETGKEVGVERSDYAPLYTDSHVTNTYTHAHRSITCYLSEWYSNIAGKCICLYFLEIPSKLVYTSHTYLGFRLKRLFRRVEVLLKIISSFFTYICYHPAGNYMFKVNNRNTRARCEICSKLTIKTPERRLASFWCLYC